MNYANQIVEGFLDKIQDVGRIAMQNLLMNNAHPIVKIIKVIQDAKIFVKTILVILLVRGLNYLDSLGPLIPVLLLPQQQQQQDDQKHQDLEGKNQFNRQPKNQRNIMTIIMDMMIIIMVVLRDTTHFIAFTMILVMVEEAGMVKSE